MKDLHKRIRIPHPTIVLHGSRVALSCGFDAELESDKLHGLFAGDTRVLSSFRMLIAGQRWTLLGWEREGSATAIFSFQNPKFTSFEGTIPDGTLLLRLRRRVDGAMHDHLWLENFGDEVRSLRLTFLIDADFSDLFDVHAKSPTPHLDIKRSMTAKGMQFSYDRSDFHRALLLNVHSSNGKPQYVGSSLVFDLCLRSQERWECCFDCIPEIGDQRLEFRGDPHEPEPDLIPSSSRVHIETDSLLKGPFHRSQRDLHALAIPQTGAPPFLAAGVPWFLTLFARDSLLTSLMVAIDGTWASEGALKALADLQATTFDDWRDAEPGKFPHEIRVGELAHFGVVPHSAYYAAHDAQELYCLALWNAWRWTGRSELLQEFLAPAMKGLEWCHTLGDRDGDGLLEYKTRSRQGYYNQSWKDAGDAIVDEKGKIASLPLATIEMQGYLYAARLAMAELHRELGDESKARLLERQAFELRELVEARYWMEDEQFYAVALDGEKRQARSISSNPGHLLWCGLVTPERAKAVANRLLSRDMFSGWGVRTLSSENPAYNPISYQCGSVWPHDTVLAASGLWRYGLYEQADTLLHAILEAASLFDQSRLPELFCGMDKGDGALTPYSNANIPQAWAAAVPLLVVQLILGIVPDAAHRRCFLSPRLPSWLDELEVRHVRVGKQHLHLKLRREDERTRLEILENTGLEIVSGKPPAPLWGAPLPVEEAKRRGKDAA